MSRLLESDPEIGGTLFNLMQCIASLRIEVSTGMRHSRGSILKHSQVTFGVTSNTKKGALAELEGLYLETTGRTFGSERSL